MYKAVICPICKGTGIVPSGFYKDNEWPVFSSGGKEYEYCRRCNTREERGDGWITIDLNYELEGE